MFEHSYPEIGAVSQRLEIAIRHIEFVRNYTRSLLDDLDDSEWFWCPESFSTHIAWQVGHLAMSEYGLTLFQQRGRILEVDSKLMSGKFRKLFMRGTQPNPDPAAYPAPTEILDVLERVHNQMRVEVPSFDDRELDQPLSPPHSAYATRYGALLFAGDHEMLHAGHIGMLRRLMGKTPLR